MANRERGEVSLGAGAKTYTLRFSIDALCQLEEATGKGIVAITQEFADPAKIRIGTTRAALWAGLREHHPEITLAEAGDLISLAGGVLTVMQVVLEAITLAFPAPDGKARPRKAVGTGASS